MELENKRIFEKEKERGCRMINQGAITKVVRDGMLDINTGKRLGKKKTITENLSSVKKPKTRWQKIREWLNTPIGGNN